MTQESPRLNLGTVNHYAAHRGVDPRTVRNWVARGYFPVYRVPGKHGVLIDRDEADALLAALPPGTIKPGFGSFGAKADVRTLGGAMTPQETAATLPPLTDEQVCRVAALLSVAKTWAE